MNLQELTDEKLASMLDGKTNDLIKERNRRINVLKEQGASDIEVAKLFGIDPATVWRVRKV